MNTALSKSFKDEAIHLVTRLAKKYNVLKSNQQIVVTLELQASPQVLISEKTEESLVDRVLSQPIDTLKLTTTAARVHHFELTIIGDLARSDEQTLLMLRGFGKRSLIEIKSKLMDKALELGMTIPMGPLEREIVMSGSIRRFCTHHGGFAMLEGGVHYVSDLFQKTKPEVRAIFEGYKKIGASWIFEFEFLHTQLQRRGIKWPN